MVKWVVIVGGGVACSMLVKLLENVAAVTLIDPEDNFEVLYFALRCLVEPRFAERSVIVHSAYMKKSQLLMASATNATPTDVTTDSGTKVPYDFLVICTGSVYDGPKTRQERLAEHQEAIMKVVDAQGILIIGGRPVGVELACEVITYFPTKKVTIVTSNSQLLEFLGSKATDKAFKWWNNRRVQIFFNDKYALPMG